MHTFDFTSKFYFHSWKMKQNDVTRRKWKAHPDGKWKQAALMK